MLYGVWCFSVCLGFHTFVKLEMRYFIQICPVYLFLCCTAELPLLGQWQSNKAFHWCFRAFLEIHYFINIFPVYQFCVPKIRYFIKFSQCISFCGLLGQGIYMSLFWLLHWLCDVFSEICVVIIINVVWCLVFQCMFGISYFCKVGNALFYIDLPSVLVFVLYC